MSNLTVYNGPRVDPAPFAEWSARHARTFSLNTDSDRATLGEWCKIFALHGFLPAELEEATTYLAANCPPKRRCDHLPALEDRINSRRRVLLSARRPDADDRGACELCGNTSWVIVPGDGTLTVGESANPAGSTIAVSCKCVLGRLAGRDKYLSLERYERRFPFWRDEMDRRAELARLRANAMAGSRMMDQTLGKILQRLRDRENKGGA